MSLAVKPVGKPDAGNPHVRFDERGWETGRRFGVSARAHPRLYQKRSIRDRTQSDVVLKDQDIIVVQAKASRLGMYLMGQAFFSAQLMRAFEPRSVESVALVLRDDEVLRPLFEAIY